MHSSEQSKKVVLMGECMLELRQIKPGIMHQSFAGDTYNTAVYQKRAFPRQDVSFMTALGQDLISHQMSQAFKAESLAGEYVFADSDLNPGVYLVQTDDEGERSFLYWRENSAARQLMQFINDKAVASLCQADLFFFSGISLAVLKPANRPTFWNMLRTLKEAGVKVAFDPNYRPRLWLGKAEAQAEFAKAYQQADILLPGIDDFKQLYDISQLQEILAFCQPFDIDELLIKNGPDSVYCQVASKLMHFPIQAVNNVVDTTSAGDSFNGVYLGARLHGLEIDQAVKLASAAAGLVIQYPGSIVPADVFDQFMQKNGSL